MKYWLYFFIATTAVLLVSLVGIVFVGLEYKQAQDKLLTEGLESKNYLLAKSNALRSENLLLQNKLTLSEEEIEDLEDDLDDEKDKLRDIEREIGDALDTVDVLDRLQKTDEELLQKYSKVYFLNEHYAPGNLSRIDADYLIINSGLQIKSEVEPFLDEMMEDASDDGVELRILSAYRSFGTQAAIKQNYVTTFGASAANTFSADQGFSEHQLGTTVDFSTPQIGSSLSLFNTTDEYAWLEENAYKYGFTLTYPEGNSYYISEPWHWRFVGKDLAKHLDRNDLHFYDMDQRDINEYLVDIFED